MIPRNPQEAPFESRASVGTQSLRARPPARTTARQCPLCQCATRPRLEVRGLAYHHCPDCSHQFLDYVPAPSHVADHYDDGYFTGRGDGYPDYLAGRDLLVARGRKYAKKFAALTGRTAGDLLDIGSAAGFLAKGFGQQGWTVQGIDPCPTMAAHANGKEHVPTTNRCVEAFETDQRFDLILLVQVIAHLEDPAGVFGKIRSLLKPGGHVLIETWDNQSLTARILKSRWHEYNPTSVLHAFSMRSLATLAEQQGFETIRSRRTIKRIKCAHAKSVISHKYGGSPLHRYLVKPALALLPNGLSLPYPADDLFWSCIRKQ